MSKIEWRICRAASVFLVCLIAGAASSAATDLSGRWSYLGAGQATIVQQGDRVVMELTWTASSVPAPHYRVEAKLSDGRLTGRWRHLSATGSSGMTGGRFQALVAADGKSISVSETEDDVHNWNSVVLTLACSSGEEDCAPRLAQPDLVSIEIVDPDTLALLEEIAVGERFRVRLTYSSEPKSAITESVVITTSGGVAEEIEVSGDTRVIMSDSIEVTPLVVP